MNTVYPKKAYTDYEIRKCWYAINKISKLRVVNQSTSFEDCYSLLDYGAKYIERMLVEKVFDDWKKRFYADENEEDIEAIPPMPENSKRVGLIFDSTFLHVLLKKEGKLWTLPTIELTDDKVDMPGIDGNIIHKFRKVSFMDVKVGEGDEEVTVRAHFFLGVEWVPQNKEECQWWDIDEVLLSDGAKIKAEAMKLLRLFYDLHFKRVEHLREHCSNVLCDITYHRIDRLVNKDTSFIDCEALLQSFIEFVDRRTAMKVFNKYRETCFRDDSNEKHVKEIPPLPENSKRVALIFDSTFLHVLLKKEGKLWTLPTIELTDDKVDIPGIDGNFLHKFRKVSFMNEKVGEGDEEVTVRAHFFLGVEWDPPDLLQGEWWNVIENEKNETLFTVETRQVLRSFHETYLRKFDWEYSTYISRFVKPRAMCNQAVRIIESDRVVNKKTPCEDCQCLLGYMVGYRNFVEEASMKPMFALCKKDFYDDENEEDINAIPPLPEGSKRVGFIFYPTFRYILVKKDGELWTLPTIELTEDGIVMPGVDGNFLHKFSKVSFMDTDVAEGDEEDKDVAEGDEEDKDVAEGGEEDKDVAEGGEEDKDVAEGGEEDKDVAEGDEEDKDVAEGDEEDIVRAHFFLGVEWEPPNEEELTWLDLTMNYEHLVTPETMKVLEKWDLMYNRHYRIDWSD